MNGDPEVTRYAVKVISDGVPMNEPRFGREMMTEDGTEFWICTGEWGDTGSRALGGGMPPDVRTFKTRDEARQYTHEWQPHPWYVKPREFRIVLVAPRMVQAGWREI